MINLFVNENLTYGESTKNVHPLKKMLDKLRFVL